MSSVVKQSFSKLGAIHSHNSTLHSAPPSHVSGKRTRKGIGNDTMDLVESDPDTPFTINSSANRLVKKHEILIKHERPCESPSSMGSTNLKASPQQESNPLEDEVRSMDRKILVHDESILSFAPEDDENLEYRVQKLALLIHKLKLLNNTSSSLSAPSK